MILTGSKYLLPNYIVEFDLLFSAHIPRPKKVEDMGDKRIYDLTKIDSAPANGVLPIDVPGSTETNSITVANLFKDCFSIQSTFEGDLDYLRTPGMYYTTGHTQNSFGTGLLVVFASSISVMQFSVNVFTGSFACRSLLFNDGKLDKWTDWRLISFT